MLRRGVECAAALMMMSGTIGCLQSPEDYYLEHNTRERAAETALWQDTAPGSIYLGSVIITPDPELKVRPFPRIPVFKPYMIIDWKDIVRINGIEMDGSRFFVRYPTLVYNSSSPVNYFYPATSRWMQLTADINNEGKVSKQQVYISFSDQTSEYVQKERLKRERMLDLISPGRKVVSGFQLYETGEIIPESALNQVSLCGPDQPCEIQPNDSRVLAQERFISGLGTLPYRYHLIQGDSLNPDHSEYWGNFYTDKENYLRNGRRRTRRPISFEMILGNSRLTIALGEPFIKNGLVYIGGNRIYLCAPDSQSKRFAYEALFENFVSGEIVDGELISTLAEGAGSCNSLDLS